MGAAILPIIISPCLYEEAIFSYPDSVEGPHKMKHSSLQSANSPSQTMIEMTESEQNRILLGVARRLLEVALPTEDDFFKL